MKSTPNVSAEAAGGHQTIGALHTDNIEHG